MLRDVVWCGVQCLALALRRCAYSNFAANLRPLPQRGFVSGQCLPQHVQWGIAAFAPFLLVAFALFLPDAFSAFFLDCLSFVDFAMVSSSVSRS